MKNKDILTVEEACEFLGISRAKLYKLKKEGLPYYKIGKLIRFNKDTILEWINTYETSDKK